MIRWNEVTWYSRLGAIVLFLGVVPALSFFVGMQYQLTTDVTRNHVTTDAVIVLPSVPSKPSEAATGTSALIRACPDEWYINAMPTIVNEGASNVGAGNNEYLIYNNERYELVQFDMTWVKSHCSIRPQTVQ